jgi:hypothetical protein
MKIQPYVEKLGSSKEYAKFKDKHKDAFLVAGFFVLDFETEQNLYQIDYYIPSQKKVAAFTLDDKIAIQIMETMNDKIPEELDMQTNIDLDALKGILEDEMKNRNMTEEIKKIIAVLQNIDGRKVWILNCVLSGMEILKSHVEDESKTVLKMEKASVLDLIKKLPGSAKAALGQGGGAEGGGGDGDEIDKQIEELDKLKEALKKEKVEREKAEK